MTAARLRELIADVDDDALVVIPDHADYVPAGHTFVNDVKTVVDGDGDELLLLCVY